MNYRTVRRFYPILVTWYNLGVDIDNWLWDHRGNKFIFYSHDLILSGFRHSSLYWELRPYIDRMIKYTFLLLGSERGLKIIRRITNDYSTKLIESSPRFCYVRNRGWINRYYDCSIGPFNYLKIVRKTFDTETQQNVNTYSKMVLAMLGGKIEELKENKITLYSGFIWTRKMALNAYKIYRKDLQEINEIMLKAREEENLKV